MNFIPAFTYVSSEHIYLIVISLGLFFMINLFKKAKNIKGQIILITGAGSGLGRQLAIQLSKHSNRLILLDIDKAALMDTEKLIGGHSTVFIYQCDVSNKKMVQEVAKKIQEEAGDVDILINNAGIVSGKYFLDLPEEKIMKTMAVNVLAHFWMCQAFLPSMMAKNSGHIVSVASIVGLMGHPRLTDYCASKYAAVGFAESLEMEMRYRKLDGIKVTIVCPCHIDTGLFDGAKPWLFNAMTPEYAAKEIIKGVLAEEETIILPYSMKYVIMGRRLIPRWLGTWFEEIVGNIKCMETFTGRNIKVDDVQELKKQATEKNELR